MPRYQEELEDRHRAAISVVVGTVILMALPILNGSPFFYFDTAAYLEQVEKAVTVLWPTAIESMGHSPVLSPMSESFGQPEGDRIVLGGRSIYYSLFAFTGRATTIWLPVVVQALTLSWLIVTLFRQMGLPNWAYTALATLTGLSLLSSASLFAGLLMPDIWAGLMVLALALLWGFGDGLDRRGRIAVWLVLSFAALSHNSHLALLAIMIGLFGLVRLNAAWRAAVPSGGVLLPLAALLVGVIGQIAFGAAVERVYHGKLVNRPFLTARLIDLGPGERLARETCPDSGYAICEFVDNFPIDWISFLFSSDPETGIFASATPAVQAALSEEQAAFTLHVIANEPAASLTGLVADGVRQLWTLSLDSVALSRNNTGFYETSFPPDLVDRIESSRIYDHPQLLTVLMRTIQLTGALSVGAIALWLTQLPRDDLDPGARAQAIDRVILILVAGVVANAMICGILASPYGRFQARVVWLLALASVLAMVRTALVLPGFSALVSRGHR